MRISDWSSDVCSSDLPLVEAPAAKPAPFELPPVDAKYSTTPSSVDRSKGVPKVDTFPELDFPDLQHATLANGSKLILAEQIGRASGRERGCPAGSNPVVPILLKKKNSTKKSNK